MAFLAETWAKWVFPVVLLALIVGCRPALAPTSSPHTPDLSPTPSSSHSEFSKLGLHLLLTDGRYDWPVKVWASHLSAARQAAGEWGYVVELVRLDDLDVARWQHFMDLCAEHHLTPIIRLATSPAPDGGWLAPPHDADGGYREVAKEYADFSAALDWPTEAHYVIVGNEPNHGSEWGGRPDPAAYARFLIDTAAALHQADPQARVLNAGFDPYTPHTGSQPFNDGQFYIDAETFLDEMVAAQPDVFNHIDAWASHAYPQGPFSEGPWVQSYGVDLINDTANPQHVEPPPGIFNRGINGYEWELFKLSAYGITNLPVLITETGWRHAESVDPASPDNGRPLPNAATVAVYLDLALRGNQGRYPDLPASGWTPWLDDERVIAVVFFALDGHPAYWGHTNWLALDERGQTLDHYPAFDFLTTLSPP